MHAEISITPGFTSKALDAQASFRAVLDAWAYPGRKMSLPVRIEPAPGLTMAASVIALTLVDADTPVWLSQTCKAARDWLAFHCGCRMVSDPFDAAFAFAAVGETVDLNQFNPGTAMTPEAGATLILQVEGFDGNTGWTLTGPGIDGQTAFYGQGLQADLFDQRAKLRRRFPAGLDFVFVSDDGVVGIPRTTLITAET